MMRIAVVKPDYHIRGGFEIVLDRIVDGLKARGFLLEYVLVDMTKPSYRLGALNIPPEVYHGHEEFFRYTTAIDKFRRLNLRGYDLVLTTQPPSFAVEHPKVVPLFYHHLKVYYDLYEAYKDSGIVKGIDHVLTKDLIREIDSLYLTDDKTYIAGSAHVASRLRRFNGITRHIYTFAAGIEDSYYHYDGPTGFKSPICVGRHEFPKRPELFVHAMKHCLGLTGKIVGEGGKTADIRWIDQYLTHLHQRQEDIEDDTLWRSLMFQLDAMKKGSIKDKPSNVIFTGRLPQENLIAAYAEALCVVCPAFEEDYGLTAIEGMAFGKPVIVCEDGGGYTEFVENGFNGFVVAPTGEGIAQAILTLNENPDQLRQMSKNAFEYSRQYSWDHALESLGNMLTEIYDLDIGDRGQKV